MTKLIHTPRRPQSSTGLLASRPPDEGPAHTNQPGAGQLAGSVAAVLLVALAAGAVRLYGRYQADLARARRRLEESGSHVAQTACGPIEYATGGEGIPVLEVHGIFGGFDQGLLVARPVLGDGFRIVAPSRFGYLGTPLPADASPARQADAHACLLDHLGIERAGVMAHSAGSPSAIQLALRHPERVAALVMVVPAAPGPGPTAPSRPIVRALFRTDALFWFLATFFPSSLPIGVPRGLKLTPDDRAEISRTMETLLPATSRRDGFLFDMFVSAPEINSGYPFGEISVPTLVVTAADDPLASPDNARRLATVIPNARLFEAERGGHLLLGQAEVVGDQVRRFIREHTAGAQPAGPSVAARAEGPRPPNRP
jgi:2-hydroxy-6-oxonona-2,4-dienedioate hydrolase